ncbi:MAG: efflux transporter outer membrane subunit [Steroidobacteraceae bacterium]
MSDCRVVHRSPLLATCLAVLVLGGCAVGPDLVRPSPASPDDWSSWSGADDSLRAAVGAGQPQAWASFGDPVLEQLQSRALQASPDLATAALRFAQARVQRSTVAAGRGPQVGVSGGVNRQRQSEYGAATRMLDAVGGAGNRAALASLLAEPFTLYQAGFDASWELDLWGRVRRAIEAADADVAQQAALLDLARLGVASDVARDYFELRTAQRQIRLAREDIAALEERVEILGARVRGGVIDHLDLDRQQTELAAARAQLPGLLAQEGASANQIALLLGERPGALRDQLMPLQDHGQGNAQLPDLTLGLPSEVAQRRPDIRAAEARLRNATAGIGIARAQLYPAIRLGARFGYESYLSGEFADWGSRTWSVGPSLDLPLFDRGRRRSVVRLRELEQQEAAVNYQRTVLKAWQEIDDALSAYTAERQRTQQLESRVHSAVDAHGLAEARYEGGTTDFIAVLDSQRGLLQALRDLAASQGRLNTLYVAVDKAVGNVPLPTPQQEIGEGK